jgi:hypothetical protein
MLGTENLWTCFSDPIFVLKKEKKLRFMAGVCGSWLVEGVRGVERKKQGLELFSALLAHWGLEF